MGERFSGLHGPRTGAKRWSSAGLRKAALSANPSGGVVSLPASFLRSGAQRDRVATRVLGAGAGAAARHAVPALSAPVAGIAAFQRLEVASPAATGCARWPAVRRVFEVWSAVRQASCVHVTVATPVGGAALLRLLLAFAMRKPRVVLVRASAWPVSAASCGWRHRVSRAVAEVSIRLAGLVVHESEVVAQVCRRRHPGKPQLSLEAWLRLRRAGRSARPASGVVGHLS